MPGLVRFIHPVLMASIMTFLMSGVVTALNTGIDPAYLARWLSAWTVTLPLGIAGVLLVSPIAQRLSQSIVALLPRRGEH